MLSFCFVPVEKGKEIYWLPSQQICSFLLQLCSLWHSFCPCWLSCQQLFFVTYSFFFSHATTLNLNLYKIYAWFISVFISGQNFSISPKAIGGKKQCFGDKHWVEYVFLFHLLTLLYFFPMNFYITSSLDSHFSIILSLFCICEMTTWYFLSLIGISVLFFTHNTLS